MGLKQKVVREYGTRYWIDNKSAILRRADRNGRLEKTRVIQTARERRFNRRLDEQTGFAFRQLFT